MDLYFSLLKKPFLFLIFLIAVILLFVDGCGDDGDIRLVDFSVANTVTRPKDHPQDEWYDPIRRMKKKVELLKEKSYALKNP